MDEAEGRAVFAITRHWLAGPRMTIVLGIESTDALLNTEIEVDESPTQATAMVDAELRLAEAIAASVQTRIFDVVVGTQVDDPDVQSRLADCVTVHNALSAQLVVLVVTGLLEGKVVGPCCRAIFVFAVAVAEVPPPHGRL